LGMADDRRECAVEVEPESRRERGPSDRVERLTRAFGGGTTGSSMARMMADQLGSHACLLKARRRGSLPGRVKLMAIGTAEACSAGLSA